MANLSKRMIHMILNGQPITATPEQVPAFVAAGATVKPAESGAFKTLGQYGPTSVVLSPDGERVIFNHARGKSPSLLKADLVALAATVSKK